VTYQPIVVAASGASMANHLTMAVVIEPGDVVLIERPTYEPLVSTARFLGAEVRRCTQADILAIGVVPKMAREVVLIAGHSIGYGL